MKSLGRYFAANFDGSKFEITQSLPDLKIAEYTILDAVKTVGIDITDEEWDILQKAMEVMRKMDKQIG